MEAEEAGTSRRRWPRRHPVWTALIVLGALGAAAAVVSRARGTPVELVRVKAAPLTQYVVVSGRVTPPAQVRISASSPGTVVAVPVDVGDRVKAGQTLIQLDAAELDAAVAQAQAGLLQARARLAQLLQVSAPAQAEAVRQAEAQLDQAERRAERVKKLAETGGATPADQEDAQTALRVAQSRLDAARAQAAGTGRGGADVRLAQAAVAQAEAALALARARRDQATLTAPAEAVVLTRDVEPGDTVTPGRIVMTLARAGATHLSVEPDEKNLAFIRDGQPAVASADAFADKRFPARVDRVAPGVNPERGTVEVRLLVPDPPDYLRPDMTVSVEIEVAKRPAALVVPDAAVRDAATGHPWVLRVRDGRAEKVPVALGLRGEGRLELRDGVAAGDRLVLTPEIAPGTRVRAAGRGEG